MKVFDKYSEYYNILYNDKDYASEASFIDSIIKKYLPSAKSVLNLGCGTGNHDFFLAQKGYEITGIDCSESNIKKANLKLVNIDEFKNCLDFRKGDVRTYRANKTYDVVISLFHVISYQTTNDDLSKTFETARAHLGKDGLFIFDCWYGPAVLTKRPEIRIKRADDNNISIIRIAEPDLFPNENRVDVNYHLVIKDKKTERVSEINETHRMRYLFKPEVEHFLKLSGLEEKYSAEWMTDNPLGLKTWNAYFIAKK